MDIFNLFVEAFKARVVIKPNQGKLARIAEFDAVVDEVSSEYGTIPDIARVRAYFIKCIDAKPNWGCRKVISTFDYTLAQLGLGD